MTKRTTEQQILDLQAKIKAIHERAERKKVQANPAVKFMAMSLRSIDKALNSTDDQVLKKALDEARATVASCLALTGVKKGLGQRTLTPRAGQPRAGSAPAVATDEVWSYVRKNPGRNSEAIGAEFGTDSATLRPILKELIAGGQVRTEGQKRGTRYFVGV